jgi:hypothetical protein
MMTHRMRRREAKNISTTSNSRNHLHPNSVHNRSVFMNLEFVLGKEQI